MKTWQGILFCCLVGLIAASQTFASPNALLPRPQEVRYDQGRLAVSGLVIRLVSPPTGEDRFAAELLAAGLSAKGENRVLIQENNASGPAILLNRTGQAGPLPGANDSAGAD